jgi:glycosyltransferase involved in cell wall biosynthesis
MEAARGVLVGSRYTAESLWAALPEIAPALEEKTRLGPPGVDLEAFRPAPGPREQLVAFVGKLIVSKGPDLLLAAWPLVHARHPRARLELAGFGAWEEAARRLADALGRGDLDAARAIAARGRGLEGGEEGPLPILSAFLAAPPAGYAEAARAAAGSVSFIGRIEHDEVATLFRRAEAAVMPSTFPEAFGMVAAEAAAAGALPVSAGHSGMLEVSTELAGALPPAVAGLASFPVEVGAIEGIAARLDAWLGLPEEGRETARASLVETAARLWSWDAVARGVLAAAAGELDALPRPAN